MFKSTNTDEQSSKSSFENLLADIENTVPGLSDNEVFAVLDINKDDYKKDDKKDEWKQIEASLIKGRALANLKAMSKLINHMENKGGGDKVCIDFLKRFATEWPEGGEYETGKGGSYRIMLDD